MIKQPLQKKSQSAKSLVTLTEAAIRHITHIIQQKDHGIGFRLSVKKTGCSGYRYAPEIIDDIQPDDYVIEDESGLLVFIDPSSESMLRGTVIDFESKGPGVQQLVYRNPNSVDECGCGESFNLKEEVIE